MANYTKDLIAKVIYIGKPSNKGKPVPEYLVAMITALGTKFGVHTDKKIDELSEKQANELLVHHGNCPEKLSNWYHCFICIRLTN